MIWFIHVCLRYTTCELGKGSVLFCIPPASLVAPVAVALGLAAPGVCFELLFDWLQKGVEAFDVTKCAHDAISPCDPPPRSLPRADRRDKAFSCDVALMDLPVDRTSDRLLGCVRERVDLSAKYLLPAPRMA